MEKGIIKSANKLHHEKKIKKIIVISLVVILLILLIFYLVIGIIYNRGNVSITLEKDLYFDNGIIIYDDTEYKVYRSELLAPVPKTFDGMSYKWLPDNLGNVSLGSHNGDNYLAYTFLIENRGDEAIDYKYSVVKSDVIKDVDEAVRVRIYRGDEDYTTYAKLSATGVAEKETVPFIDDKTINTEEVFNFSPGDINKYTIVMWVEGTDLECTDNILGGEIKVSMNFEKLD